MPGLRSSRLLVLACVLAGCAHRSSAPLTTLARDVRFESFIGLDDRPLAAYSAAQAPASAPQAAPLPAPHAQATPALAHTADGYVAGAARPNRYAIVIGIERYREARQVPGAARDAQRFAQVASVTMGVPAANVKLLVNEHATKADVENAFAWVGMRTTSRSEVLVFFAGHGSASSDANNKLMPLLFTYEGNLSEPGSALSLYSLLADLGSESKPNAVVAFIDACSESIAQNTRGGVVFSPKTPDTVVFSAASIGELSSPLQDGSSGVFTGRLLDAIGRAAADANGDGDITLGEIDDYVTSRVRRYATETLGRRQNPTLVKLGKLSAQQVVLAEGLTTTP